MKRLLYALLLAISAVIFSVGQVALSQNVAALGPVQTGFAVITPLTGDGSNLSVSETFVQRLDGNLFQSSVLPSPLVTLTDVVINFNVSQGTNTGIAVVNPNDAPATAVLTLSSDQGAAIASRTLVVGGHQQISAFVTDLFGGASALPESIAGLLFIRSDQGIGVLGLSFNGPSFSSLPVAAQLNTSNLIATSTGATNGTVSNIPGSTTGVVPPAVTVNSTVTPTSALGVIPPLSPSVTGTPITGVTPPLAATASPTAATVNVGTNVNAATDITGAVNPIASSVTVNSTGAFVTTPMPQVTAGIGGIGALLLPQVAVGGGWNSQITIANTAAAAQFVRVDFFGPGGAPLELVGGSSLPNVIIPAGGVVVLTPQ
jgi:hypothetical protein